jgi:hypothetical protein
MRSHRAQKEPHPLRRLHRMEFVDLPRLSLRDPALLPGIPSHITAAMASHRFSYQVFPHLLAAARVQLGQAGQRITDTSRAIVDASVHRSAASISAPEPPNLPLLPVLLGTSLAGSALPVAAAPCPPAAAAVIDRLYRWVAAWERANASHEPASQVQRFTPARAGRRRRLANRRHRLSRDA